MNEIATMVDRTEESRRNRRKELTAKKICQLGVKAEANKNDIGESLQRAYRELTTVFPKTPFGCRTRSSGGWQGKNTEPGRELKSAAGVETLRGSSSRGAKMGKGSPVSPGRNKCRNRYAKPRDHRNRAKVCFSTPYRSCIKRTYCTLFHHV